MKNSEHAAHNDEPRL